MNSLTNKQTKKQTNKRDNKRVTNKYQVEYSGTFFFFLHHFSLVRSSSDFLNKLDLYAALEQKLKLNTLRLDGAEKGSNNENSFNFIYGLIWACFLMIIWKNVWIIHILPIPFAIYFIKHLGEKFYYFSHFLHLPFLIILKIFTKQKISSLVPAPHSYSSPPQKKIFFNTWERG